MKPALWMVGGSVMAWLAAMALLGTREGLEMFLGMLAPLAVVAGTWILTERTYRRSPERLTSLMVTAFAGKLVFFGAYVAVMLRVLLLRPVPFMVSFASYFIVLYVVEALSLRRLFR